MTIETTPASDWGTIELAVNRTYEYTFDLYEGDGATPLVIESADVLRMFVWNTDEEDPSDLNCNSGATSDTFTAGGDTLTSGGNHLLDNGAAVTLSTTGALPGGLDASTTYYVISRTATTFKLTTVRGDAGSIVTTTDAGTGTHTWTKASKITINTVGVAGTTPAQVTVHFDELDTQNLATGDYSGELVLCDNDDGGKAKPCGRGIVSVLGTGGGELGLGG